METLDALTIAAMIADESNHLVKMIAIGIRIDGSIMVLNSDMTEGDLNALFKDHRAWIGEHLGKEMMNQS